ncbi:MAG TPA: aminopeptidase N, partial [Bdellovibrionota bacterium]|nr:aminopeptidase N [Bdellovibrionota bacterium]
GVAYSLWLKVGAEGEDFDGRVVIQFETKKPAKNRKAPSQLPIDFTGGAVKALSVNGTVIQPAARYDGRQIVVESSELRDGPNRIEISFTHPYSNNGQGLHRSKDPKDGEVYLYTQFEPFDANRMFPCFDQPDLKATYEMTVEVPAGWTVISNTREREINTVDGRKAWAFPRSPVMSTYLFALIAGPWASWKGDADGIPLRLFARKSVAEFVDEKGWFDVTRKGFSFYQEEFGVPYPYVKYDQILVPDFNAGAMENTAAVTFSEDRYVFRTRESQMRYQGRASVILHEMAHMWFGDLVTMRWWNGLWLNESFATYMASLAQAEAIGDKSAWLSFFGISKGQTAYHEDQLATTHPIEVPVPATDTARTLFDGITYGKGAAVLKQLRHFVGEEDFREGLTRYFTRFASKNTSVADFMRMFAEASGKDLKTWEKQWLRTTGMNTVRTTVTCDADKKISKLVISQGNAEYSSELRTHKAELALYDEPPADGKTKLKPATTLEVAYWTAETDVPEAVGKPCPAFVFPNNGDHDYVKVLLDPASAQFALKNAGRFRDPLMRQMAWHTLWESVLDGNLKARDWLDAVVAQLGHETEPVIVNRVLARALDSKILRQGGDQGLNRVSALRLLASPAREEYAARLDTLARAKLGASAPGSDLQLVWYQAVMDAAVKPDTIAFVRSLVPEKGKKGHRISGMRIEKDRRWEAILALSRSGAPDAAEIIKRELEEDPSDAAKRALIRAEAQMPDPATKKRWLDRIVSFPDYEGQLSTLSGDPDKLPISKLREAGRFFHQLGQEELTRQSVEPYFQLLAKLPKVRDEEFALRLVGPMFPMLCDPAIGERASQMIRENSDLPATAVKALRNNVQENLRCAKAREKSG